MKTKSRPSRKYLLFPVAIGLTLIGWSLASPVGSTPDEPSHVARAYSLVTGKQGLFPQTDGLAAPLPEGFEGVGAGDAPYVLTQIPHYFVEKPRAGCYAFDPTKPAQECLPEITTDEVTVKGFQSYFVPGYALFAGSLLRLTEVTGLAEIGGLTITRAISAFFNGVIVGWALLLALPRTRWRFAGLIALLILMPLTAFSLSSISPSSWEISGTLLMTGGLIAVSRSSTKRVEVNSQRSADLRRAFAAVALGAFMAATARPFGLMWVATALVVSLILLRHLPKLVLAFMGALVALGVWWLVWSARFQREEIADPFRASQGGLQPREILDFLLVGGANYFGRVLTVWSDYSNTGWIDTPTPALLSLIWAFGWVIVIVGALSLNWAGAIQIGSNSRFLLWLGAAFGLSTFILFVFLFSYVSFTVQSRHLLPGVLAAATCIGVLGLTAKAAFAVRPKTVNSILFASTFGLAVAVVLSLLWTQWRYAYGLVIRDPVGLTTRTQEVAFWLPAGGLWLPPAVAVIGLVIAAFALRPSQKNTAERVAGTSSTVAA